MATRRRNYRIGCLALAGLAAGAAPLVWWFCSPAELDGWHSGPPSEPWASLQRQEELWRREGSTRRVSHVWAPLEDISIELQLAVLVGEDIGFLDHGAIDPRAILEALDEWSRGGRLRGASTISQQLAKTLFLSHERSLSRKLQEARLAWWLERDLGKRRILELYLNVVEFGPGVVGAEAAAGHFAGVSAAELAKETAAGLAAAIPSPGRDNPATASQRWSVRRQTILVRMGNATWLRRRLEALQQ